MALFNNWGEKYIRFIILILTKLKMMHHLHVYSLSIFKHSMTEPFYDGNMGGTIHTKIWAQRFCDLRDQALSLPKYGTSTADDEVL